MVFHRSFSEGRYDGLDLPIERGDYGLTEVKEGSWIVKHSYYSMEKELKGDILQHQHSGRILPLWCTILRSGN